METKVVFVGVASANVPFVIAEEPVLVTTCVYVMLLPACTGLGDATFVTERFGPEVPTIVVTTAVLLAGIGSRTEELTVADPVITAPFAVPFATLTTYVNVAELSPGMLALVHTELPPFPVRQLHPAGGVSETKVVLFGNGKASVALSAALSPLL